MNKQVTFVISLLVFISASSCHVGKSSFSASKKYAPELLQRDYAVFQTILETHHPGLYWYTGKDSMDYYFAWGKSLLSDSLTEPAFRRVLSFVTAKINCGHTSVRSSKAWNKYSDTVRLGKLFPLSMKIWQDTMVVTANLNRRDSVLKRGTLITGINGIPAQKIVDSLVEYISTDGYNKTHKYQTLSNRGYFGSLYALVYGPSEKYTFDYKDETGVAKIITVPVFDVDADTIGRMAIRQPARIPQPSKKERKRQQKSIIRLLRIDSVNHSAMMTLSTFAKGYGLKRFFRNSFNALSDNKIEHLIVDVRGNGGGSVNNSTQITRYLAKAPFKISDSLFAIKKKSPYDRYIQNHFWNNLFITLFTKKRKDGNYHFGYFERHYFKPKKNNHYDGQTYIVTGGNSFSATTLFAAALVKQDNVTVVGEETGGGAYGNSAWLIPDVTLPETGVRFRLPLFRLVIDKTTPKNGRGVQPEVNSFPDIETIRRNGDYKIEKVMELIEKDKAQKKN